MKTETWSFQYQGNAPVQEDVVLVHPHKKLWILADGFGGSHGYAAANQVAVAMSEFIEQESGDLDATLPFEIRRYFSLAGNVLFNAVSYANKKLNEKLLGASWAQSGGASVVAAYLDENRLAFASVGACRIYLSRSGRIQRLNTPRSLASWLSPSGDLESTHFEVPLMSFGTVSHLEPEIGEMRLQAGDQVFLESSGVNDVIRTEILGHGSRNPSLVADRNSTGILITATP